MSVFGEEWVNALAGALTETSYARALPMRAEGTQRVSRKRFVDPEMWRDPAVAKMTRDERLMFVGIITVADDEGRLNASPAALQGAIYPNDPQVTPRQVRMWRSGVVHKLANVHLYEHDGVEYISLRRWERYQKPSHPTQSKLPPPARGTHV